MLKRLTLTGALVALAAGAMPAQEHTPVKLTGLDWRTDLEAARTEARTAGKPLFAVFR